MSRQALFVFFIASLSGSAQNAEELVTKYFGEARAVTHGSLASIRLRVFRPYGTDLQILLRVEKSAVSLSAVETTECVECALAIAESKGPEARRNEFLRLASIAPRRANRQLTNAAADAFFVEGKKVIANRAQAFSLEDGRTKIVFHPPYYVIELKTGLETVTAEFHAGDFEDKQIQWGKNDFIPFIRKLVAASGLRQPTW